MIRISERNGSIHLSSEADRATAPAHGTGHDAALLNPLPVTVTVVAEGLSASNRFVASALVVPAMPGMATVVEEPRRTRMSAPPAASLPAVATELPLM